MTVAPDETYCRGIAEMLDAIPERVIRFRVTDHTISYCNTAWAAGHDAEPADVIGHKIHEFLSPTEMDGLEFRLARLSSDDVGLANDVARTAPNSRARWVERVDRCLPDAGGAEVLVVSRDVTHLRHLQEDLAARALHDPLTGLANRCLFQELLKADLARTQRSGQPLAVAYLDLDGFKNINDTHGHDAGDAVLCETARRLLSIVRGADVVARLGGDEFVILYEPNDPSSDNLIARIDRALSAPIDITPATAVSCSASIGIADTRKVGSDATALLAAADDAMYESKRARHSARDV